MTNSPYRTHPVRLPCGYKIVPSRGFLRAVRRPESEPRALGEARNHDLVRRNGIIDGKERMTCLVAGEGNRAQARCPTATGSTCRCSPRSRPNSPCRSWTILRDQDMACHENNGGGDHAWCGVHTLRRLFFSGFEPYSLCRCHRGECASPATSGLVRRDRQCRNPVSPSYSSHSTDSKTDMVPPFGII